MTTAYSLAAISVVDSQEILYMVDRTDLWSIHVYGNEANVNCLASFTATRYKNKYPWWQARAWGWRRMAFGGSPCRWWFKCDRWAFDLPWFSFIVELWFLRRG